MNAGFKFEHTFAESLEGFYTLEQPDAAPEPHLIRLNESLAQEFGLTVEALQGSAGANWFSGTELPAGAKPLAQAYSGHQFGQFSPQLGDGRALLLGELLNENGERFDVQLKGSGPTPFSRGGDGKAAIGPVLREYLLSEAMYKLGIPTTRSLAAVTTGEPVFRNRALPGAVLTRVASSHLRIGTFQYFAARGMTDEVQQLADYAIQRHYPELIDHPDRYLEFYTAVMHRQAELVSKWMAVGFVHGVMNTDNMTICGETIDYGPCAFMDDFNLKAVYSSIDQRGRYAYGNQPGIAQWNLARLAETLLPLFHDEQEVAIEMAGQVINGFFAVYDQYWLTEMRAKLGLVTESAEDGELVTALFNALHGQEVDFTLFFRHLAEAVTGDEDVVTQLFKEPAKLKSWLEQWRQRSEMPGELEAAERVARMNRVNPCYIPRNHKVEEALQAAEEGNYQPFEQLLTVLSSPYEPRDGLEDYAQPAPESFGRYVTYCGT